VCVLMRDVASSLMHILTVYKKVIMCVCVNAGRGFKSHAYTHSVQEGHHVCVCVCVNAGRGFKSHAYTHSVQEGHHVFLCVC